MKFQTAKRMLMAVLFMLIIAVPAAQAGKHDALTALLIDLGEWQGDKAEGMTMDMGSMQMITATRNYEKGDKELVANIMISSGGQSAMGMGQGQMQAMNVETDDAKMNVTEVDGYHVQTVYEKKENKGTVMVFLAKGQMMAGYFNLSYEGLSEDAAMGLAKKFDWGKMKKAVEQLL